MTIALDVHTNHAPGNQPQVFQTRSCRFSIKNTFIDVSAREPEQRSSLARRSMSLPACLRGQDNSPSEHSNSEDDHGEYLFEFKDKLSQERTNSPDGVSTPSDVSDYLCSSPAQPKGNALPPTVLPLPVDSSSMPWELKPDNIIIEPKAPPGPQNFVEEAANIVAAIAEETSKYCAGWASITTTQDRRGWSVIARVHPDDLWRTAHLLECGQEVLLRAAKHSSCVHVMGNCGKPFRITLRGFGAMLGHMENQSNACWDVYAGGKCPRGTSCRWQHPACSKRLYVSVRPIPGRSGK